MGALAIFCVGMVFKVVLSCIPLSPLGGDSTASKPTTINPLTDGIVTEEPATPKPMPSTIMLGCMGTLSELTFTEDGIPCVFPFFDGDAEYSECADWRGKYQWCATSLKTDCGFLKWGKCQTQGVSSIDPTTTTTMLTTEPAISTIMNGCLGTISSTSFTEDGMPCVFPFYDGDTEYSECADWKGKYQWCATSLKTDCKFLKWGRCLPKVETTAVSEEGTSVTMTEETTSADGHSFSWLKSN